MIRAIMSVDLCKIKRAACTNYFPKSKKMSQTPTKVPVSSRKNKKEE